MPTSFSRGGQRSCQLRAGRLLLRGTAAAESISSITTSAASPWLRSASHRQLASWIATARDQNGELIPWPRRTAQPHGSLTTLKVCIVEFSIEKPAAGSSGSPDRSLTQINGGV